LLVTHLVRSENLIHTIGTEARYTNSKWICHEFIKITYLHKTMIMMSMFENFHSVMFSLSLSLSLSLSRLYLIGKSFKNDWNIWKKQNTEILWHTNDSSTYKLSTNDINMNLSHYVSVFTPQRSTHIAKIREISMYRLN
jgi:hypothetical protein